jgi:hypothetical protein
MRVVEIINQKLTDSLSPTKLEIVDDSHKHAGHAGARPEGESHFSVTIVPCSAPTPSLSGYFRRDERVHPRAFVANSCSWREKKP